VELFSSNGLMGRNQVLKVICVTLILISFKKSPHISIRFLGGALEINPMLSMLELSTKENFINH
jgi:hypothetical protein